MKNKITSGKGGRRKPFREGLPKDYPWKILGWLADDLSQFLEPEESVLVQDIVRNRDLERLLSLSQTWGLQSIPPSGLKLEGIRARYQLASLLKKFRFPTEKAARKLASIQKFVDGETSCYLYNLEGYRQLTVGSESWMVDAFTYAKAYMQKLLGYDFPTLEVLTERSRHGPGATLDTEANFVNSYFKFAKWPYQCTAAAYRYARFVISHDKRWLGALEDDYRTRFNIPKWAILDRKVFWATVLEVVDGNRIAFVPKDARTERTIAIEPTMNLYLQLGVDGYIRRRLKRRGIDLNSQLKNQKLARLGSQQSVNPFVTIDLANASNSISKRLCKELLPEDWYDYLVALRSPCGMIEGVSITYEMFSSMGNGYTFALESALFAAIIYGVEKATNGTAIVSESSVFGDDLIVRQNLYERLVVMLGNCGFKVNADKSFVSGPVRESCGCDFFQGRPVRPVFLSEIPEEVDKLFTDINRLKRILSLRWCLEESKTIRNMSKWIPESYRHLKGPYSDESFDSYIHSALPCVQYKRWVYKYEVIVRKPIEARAPSFWFRRLMHDLHPVPPKVHKWDHRLTGSGGRFDVFRSYAYTLSRTHSLASHWQDEYEERMPALD